jgi:glucokinase
VAAGVVDEAGQVHSFVVAPSEPARGAVDGIERLFELGRRAIAESGRDISAVGIGCGGPLDAEAGVLVAPPHLPGWLNVPVAALASQAFDVPAILENDGTAAAAAEHRFGAGREARNLIYLTISTGVGGGIVIDNKLYRGSAGNGGELGHVTIDYKGRPCRGCGRLGCLEAYVSGTSIAERAREAVASDGNSVLARIAEPTAQDVAAAALEGDPLATALWDGTVEALACGLVSLVNLFEPEMVVIGGGVSRTGEQLLGPVRAKVLEGAMSPAGAAASIVASALGDKVGVIGAASVVFERAASGLVSARG